MAEYYTHTSEYDVMDDMRSKQQPFVSAEPAKVLASDYKSGMGGMGGTGAMGGMGGMGRPYMYNMGSWSVDWRDLFKRGLKYLMEGLAVALVAYYFTKGKLDFKEIALLGITAAFVFAILDTFSPTISLGARLGAGFGVGQTMFGLNPAVLAAAV